MTKNLRPPMFRAPWLPSSAQRLAAWRKEQRRLNPDPPARAAGRYDKDWKELRAQVLAEEPMCRECARHGIERQAVTVDHIVPCATPPSAASTPPTCSRCAGRAIIARPTARMAALAALGCRSHDDGH